MDYFKERKEKREIKEQRYKKMAMNKYLSIITLNVNGLMSQSKDRVAEWIRKHDLHICCLAAYKRLTSEQKTFTD